MKATPQRHAARSTKGAQGKEQYLSVLLRAAAVGIAASAVLLLVFSMLMSSTDVPFGLVNPMSAAALIVGSMLAGFAAARQLREHGMQTGALAGFLIFLVLLMASVMFRFEIGIQALIKLAMAVVSGAIGGIFGVNARRRRK